MSTASRVSLAALVVAAPAGTALPAAHAGSADAGSERAYSGHAGSVTAASAHAGSAVPRTSRVSTCVGGREGDGASAAPVISANGRYVAFTSAADNLVRGDRNGVADVFVRDLRTGRTQRVAEGPAAGSPALSADGRRVAFVSSASNLVPGDTNGVADIFVKDLKTGAVERVSLAADGSQADGASDDVFLSGSGRAVFSSTAANLVPGDTNGVADIFVREAGARR